MNRARVWLMTAGLLIAGARAYGQDSSRLAGCLGHPLTAYGKAFEDMTTETKRTPHGTLTVGDYKTGSARIEVVQKAGAKAPDLVNVFYYQQPQRDWKLALKDIGVSSVGAAAKEDAKHQVHLRGIKAGRLTRITAVYIPLDKDHPDGPELHIHLQ